MSRDARSSGGDFWSRRRAAVAAEERADAEAVAEAQEASEVAAREAAEAEKSDTEVLEELGLPDPDSMSQGDDFTAFMKSEVPDRLRRRALRQLWRSNPTLANLDALVDYGEDFTDSATVVENLQTAYRVGKGMLAHIEKQAETAEPDNVTASNTADTEPEPSEVPKEPAERVDAVAEAPVLDTEAAPAAAASTSAALPPEPKAAPEPAPLPRRMRFVYGGIPGDRA